MRRRIIRLVNQLQRNLQYLIEKHGTNPTALAAATGVTQPTIHRILSGESKDPRTANLEKLANHFNVTVETLRTGTLRTQGEGTSTDLEMVAGATNTDTDDQPRRKPGDWVRPKETREAIERFTTALAPAFRIFVERTEKLQGQRYRFAYSSDKVVADFLVVPERNLSRKAPLPTSAKLWRLSVHRVLTKETNPNRRYYLFVVVPEGNGVGSIPLYALSRAVTEAKLHGIDVVLATATDAGEWVSGVEEKGVQHWDSFDDDYDDNDL